MFGFTRAEQGQSSTVPNQLYVHKVGHPLLDSMQDTVQSCFTLKVLVTEHVCAPCTQQCMQPMLKMKI